MFRDLVIANRSYRRFAENQSIDTETLTSLVDLARLTPSAANLQPLKYILSNTPERNEAVFSTLGWAGYLPDWPGPVEGERPSAYIIVLCDTQISKQAGCDHGIAAQTILLGATELGLGGLMFGSIKRDQLRMQLEIDERYDILLVIALGKPIEEVVLEDVGPDGNIKYYRDDKAVHHVPKRSLEEVIISR